jgi:hypothetical protein
MPKSKTRTAEKDAITLLKEDHKKIYPAFREAAEKQDAEGVLTKLVELVRPS